MGKPILNDIRLFVGPGCWEYAKGFLETQAVLVLPDHTDPTQYQWPVAGKSILVTDCTFLTKKYSRSMQDEDMRKLAHTLLAEKATVVRIICSKGSLRRYGGDSV